MFAFGTRMKRIYLGVWEMLNVEILPREGLLRQFASLVCSANPFARNEQKIATDCFASSAFASGARPVAFRGGARHKLNFN